MPTLVPVDHDPFAIPKPGQTVAAPPDPYSQMTSAAGMAVNTLRPYWADLDPTDREIVERGSAMQLGQTGPGKVLPTTGMNPVPFAALDIGSMLPVGGVAKLAGAAVGAGAKGALKAAAETGAEAAERAGIRAYHGSPYDFDRFDLSKIGTGEGAQAYGHGLYFAENPQVAQEYRRSLAPRADSPHQWLSDAVREAGESGAADWLNAQHKQLAGQGLGGELEAASIREALAMLHSGEKPAPKGRMYEVAINANPEHFLDWDKPLSEQPHVMQNAPQLLEAAKNEAYNRAISSTSKARSDELWRMVKDPSQAPGGFALEAAGAIKRNNPTAAEMSQQLNQAGIPGIKYLDQGSRTAGEGSRNYVVFDHRIIDILKKYGIAGLGAFPAGSRFLTPVDHDPFQGSSNGQ